MAKKKFDRAAFYAKVEALDADALRKLLWNLYWPAPAPLRERIEDALEPRPRKSRRKRSNNVDAQELQGDVTRFVGLARSGAYMGGTREVSRQERSKWRLTCKRLVDEATTLLSGDDFEAGAATVEALIDLLTETRHYEYFHSEDPVAAARVVVSDSVRTLWTTRLRQQGFRAFANSAAPQLIRWESVYGWTRYGGSKVAEKETSLATVLARMLRGQDAWEAFTTAYIEALDEFAPKPSTENRRGAGGRARRDSYTVQLERYALKERARNLAEWHALLLERLDVDDTERRLDRIAAHPALAGPDTDFMKARISLLRNDDAQARKLIGACLKELPGHPQFIAFAREIGAPLPR